MTEIDERNDEIDPVTGERVNTQAVTGALKASGAAIYFVGIVALFGFMFVFALSVFHIVLIWQNQTTYENFRERRVSEDNPYTRGNCCKTCFEIFCEPIPPSWFDFEQYVDEDDSADRFAEHAETRIVVARARPGNREERNGKTVGGVHGRFREGERKDSV